MALPRDGNVVFYVTVFVPIGPFRCTKGLAELTLQFNSILMVGGRTPERAI